MSNIMDDNMKKGQKMSEEQKTKIGEANKISVKKYWDKHPKARKSHGGN